MKRFAMFLVWTVVVWACILFVGSQISQVMQASESAEAQQPETVKDSFTVGLRAGVEAHRAGFAFAKANWLITLGISVAVAGLGSVTRVLPGTTRPTGPPPLPTT